MMAVGGVDVDWTDELSESQLEQHEEIEALQSILVDPGQFKLLSSPKDGPDVLFSMQLNVCVKTKDGGMTVEAWVPYEHDIAQAQHAVAAIPSNTRPQFARSDSGRHWHSSFHVQHLTPLCLQVTLPQGYPNDAAPIFTLSCLWLDSSQITVLCQQLDKLWEEQATMPIIYTWIDWLEHNALEFLALTETVILTPYLDADTAWMGNRDPRALPECVDLDVSLNAMLQHHMQRDRQEFLKNNHDCGICFDEKPGRDFFRISDCYHHFCRECMTDYCNLHVGEGTVQQLHCPDNDCKFALPPVIIEAVLGNEEFQRWERLLLQKALDTMGDITWCPRCNNAVIKESEENLKLAHCTTCMYSFCTDCDDPWHQGQPCKDLEGQLKELKDNTKTKTSSSKTKRLNMIAYLSKQTLKKITKPCPKCKVPIQKNLGCSLIHCTNCGAKMCYICGKNISDKGYEHFGQKCQLFTGDAYNIVAAPPVQQHNERDLNIREQLQNDPDAQQRMKLCPKCKQRNLKEKRNNHIRCWQCNSNFCYMCNTVIQGKIVEHFMNPRSTCQQHSDD